MSMIYPVFMPKVYIEKEGRRIEVKNIINMNSEIIDILPNFEDESNVVLNDRMLILEAFDVFIVFGDKEYSMLGSVDNEQTLGYGPDLITLSPAFGEFHMYIHLKPKE